MLIVEKYDDEHYAIAALEPIEAIKFLMEQNRWHQITLNTDK
jgi:antitoxin component HigA of HigAB toxin-antitoxin module